MTAKEKEHTRLKLATCFRIILQQKKTQAAVNVMNDKEDLRLVKSIRQLEAESGLSYTILQGLFAGKREIQFSSLLTAIESMDLTLTEFAKMFDAISAKEIQAEKKQIEKAKKG